MQQGFDHSRLARGDVQVSLAELGPGEAVLWEQGEWHESGSDKGMMVIVVEGQLELFD